MRGAGDPVGLPGFAILAVGMFAFAVALFAAGRGRTTGDVNATRSRRSWLGVLVQAVALGVPVFAPVRVALDPLGAQALAEAAGVALLMAGAVGLFVWATRTMGRNWSIVARTRADHALVTTGPFALVRHPIYVALFLLLVAFAIALGSIARLWLAVPLYALGTWLRIAEEERLLYTLFGEAYDAYAARVKRFVPGLF